VRRRKTDAIALITVLLLLAAMLVMAASMHLAVLFNASLARNRLHHALASAAASSLLNHSLLLLEQAQAGTGTLPEFPPELPGLHGYEWLGDDTVHIVVLGSSEPGGMQVSSEATVRAGSDGRLEVLQIR